MIDDAIRRAEACSPFLRGLIARRADVMKSVRAGDISGAIASAHEPGDASVDLIRALRRERQAVALAVAIGDLAGLWPLEAVVAALSDFADRAVERALALAMRERGADTTDGFVVLALGKHGSRELNYSSDIDPILLFDPDRVPRRRNEEPVEGAARIARRLVELLQARDGDGYVFRVDLRLRPSPEATPPALPIDAAIAYYESSALPWERAAFIRARPAAGDLVLGHRFLAAIRPFLWRRGLGYGAIGEIQDISRRIRGHYAHGQHLGPGFDLKRGRGGIREVEFFAQILQLVHGGRDPTVRAPATPDALRGLADAGLLPRTDAMALAAAYRLYRTIEHRLQMIDDRQTHSLPTDGAALDTVARLDGQADGAALVAKLAPHVAAVGVLYDRLAPERPEGVPHAPDALDAVLATAGFPEPAAVRARIEGWRAGRARALRTPAAQTALEAVLPGLIAAFGAAADSLAGIAALDRMIGGLPTTIDFFRLIEARPGLGTLVADVLAVAPGLAEQLARRPVLLDGLIDRSALDPPPAVAALVTEFLAGDDGDYQQLLDRVRVRVGERRFALGVQIVTGATDPIVAAEGYARVAEAAIAVLAAAATTAFEGAHGRVPGGELVILALGRLGGAVLTHASDLDLIYLFSGDHLAESDGRKPLGATTYYNRLAQRVTAALSVATAAGPLYEVDTRLRPSGAQGLLAVSIDSFARYQAENAWTWEHMALTRARPVFGSAGARAEVQAVVRATLLRPRDPAVLIADAVAMRAEMARHKPPAGPWDVKLVPGGLVDAEFAVHVLQLGHGIGLDTRLRVAASALADAGLLDVEIVAAHALLTRILVTMRLVSPMSGDPPAAAHARIARLTRTADWAALVAARDAACKTIAGEWARIAAGGGVRLPAS